MRLFSSSSTLFATILATTSLAHAAKVDFNRDIRPILSDKCFACHGPDAKRVKGDLRLDLPANATKVTDGKAAIFPGHPDKSLIIERILTKDKDDVMPPPETNKKLTSAEAATLRQWVSEGAVYDQHWAYRALSRPKAIQAKDGVIRNPIDTFVLARLAGKQHQPSPEADKVTLIRRLKFDLLGLPPTPAEVKEFVEDNSAKAYEHVVDRLLKSPHYGERMAIYWLDLVRYADTRGYHGDQHQDVVPYRDYVISAFNDNMRFDQFTTEQLAGDLLPDGTIRSKIASGYNRLLMTTEEGGAQAKEYTAKYAADRVRNASSVWLGSTLGCAECHDHKYDPFKQKDFYSFAAFFADVKETAVGKLATIPLPSEEQKKTQDRLNKDISALEKSIRDELAKIKYEEPDAGSEAKAASARPVKSAGVGKPSELILIDDEHPDCKTVRVNGGNHPFQWTEAQVFSGKRAWKRSDKGVSQDIFDDLKKPFVVAKGDKVFAHVFLDSKDPPKSIMLQYYSASWMHRANWGDADAIPYGTKGTSSKYLAGDLPEAGKWVRLEVDVEKIGITPGTTIGHFAFTQNGGTVFWDKAGLLTSADQSKMNAAIKGDPLEEQSKTSFAAWQKWIARKKYPGIERGLKGILQKKEDKRNKGEAKKVLDYYLENVHAPSRKIFGPLQAKLNPARQKRSALEKQIVRTMVSETTTPRVMRILPRGNWLDESGEVVEPMIPVSLGKLDLTEKRRANRLDLAKWFASRENPLVSRVFVNRLWKLMFGRGLSRSLDDFGMQGTSPSHPELLDWLSVEFIESGWDIKHMLKVIALSHTYRQSSIVNEKLLLIDPYNDLLARQGRFRLDAEMVRDNALQVSGLLVDNVGGSSARPYQPTGYWMHLNFPKRTYVSDTDDGQYRRGVYTYWCRTFLHPSLAAFDASTREECVVERVRSNTPQQALVLLNDPTYVEAARKFAERITKEGGQTVNSRIRFAYRHALAREPRPDEVSLLENLFQKHLKDYQADPEAAEKLLTVGLAKNDSNSGKPELAAWTSISRVVFNLHEFITRQ